MADGRDGDAQLSECSVGSRARSDRCTCRADSLPDLLAGWCACPGTVRAAHGQCFLCLPTEWRCTLARAVCPALHDHRTHPLEALLAGWRG